MVFSFFDSRKVSASAPAPLFRGIATVRAYWEGMRQEGQLPTRADLDPRGIASVLDQVFVAERIGTGLVRMRIAGTALADLCGMDMKGLPLSVLARPEARLRLAEVVERVFTTPQLADLHLEAETGLGRPTLQARLLLLPLRKGPGADARDLILGCLATDGHLGRAPRRFAITRVVQERLVLPDTTAPQAQPEILAAFAEPLAGPPVAPARLRLVYSAD